MEREIHPASTQPLQATLKRPEGRAPVRLRVYSCSLVVDSVNKNAPDLRSEAWAFIAAGDER